MENKFEILHKRIVEELRIEYPKRARAYDLSLQGLTFQKIGEALKVTRAAAHKRVKLARGFIRRRFLELAPEVEGEEV